MSIEEESNLKVYQFLIINPFGNVSRIVNFEFPETMDQYDMEKEVKYAMTHYDNYNDLIRVERVD